MKKKPLPSITPAPNGKGRIITHEDGRRTLSRGGDHPFDLHAAADGIRLSITPRRPTTRPRR